MCMISIIGTIQWSLLGTAQEFDFFIGGLIIFFVNNTNPDLSRDKPN